jgi:hypothetical protein
VVQGLGEAVTDRATGKVYMARLARIDSRLSELDSKSATLLLQRAALRESSASQWRRRAGVVEPGLYSGLFKEIAACHEKEISGVVYFIRAGEVGPIKIGHASSVGLVESRRVTLQCGNHEQLTTILIVPGTGYTERYAHSVFADLHIRGEWFSAGHDLLHMLDLLAPVYDLSVNPKHRAAKLLEMAGAA